MTRKRDTVTGEEFECTGDSGQCWCFALPPLSRTDPSADCYGPLHLAALLRADEEECKKSSITNSGIVT